MKLYGKYDLCQQLQITPEQLQKYVAKGLPVASKTGNQLRFSMRSVKNWLKDYEDKLKVEASLKAQEEVQEDELDKDSKPSSELEAVRIKKIILEIERLQLKYDTERSLLVEAASIQSYLEKVFSRVRASITAIPGRVASSLVGISDTSIIIKILNEEVASTLLKLSLTDVEDDEDTDMNTE